MSALVCMLLYLLILSTTLANEDVTASRAERLIQRRCRGTVGGWCGQYDRQPVLPDFKEPPRGSKECPQNCNGVGNCNHDTGLCECPAGWQGESCSKPLQRPCTTRFRDSGEEAVGHIDKDGRDLNPLAEGYTESRCIGICDADVARCFCDGKYRMVPAPPGSPPGTPPLSRGRPLGNHLCQPSDDGKGNALPWGQVPWSQLYGPEGWCEADNPSFKCPCMYDGFGGELCDRVVEMFCPNQCSGHGSCQEGFCKCHEGWYGTDCARKRAGADMEPGLHRQQWWLRSLVNQPPAAAGSSSSSSAGSSSSGGGSDGSSPSATSPPRKRPFIYVYDLPPAYNARMLQYRVEKTLCTWRAFEDGNSSHPVGWTYGIEALMHEMMLQSNHRTFDPEEADYFYMPLYTSCFIFPIHCWADGPWWYAPSGPRVMHVTNMMIEARDWVRKQFPYWDRRGGRDHIWLMSHDEGACYAPTDIYNASIFLTHWGRTDLDHRSNTAFTPDNYTQEYVHDAMQPNGWLHLIQGHPCFTPGKDLVVPALKFPHMFASSPLLGASRQQQQQQQQAAGGVTGNRQQRDVLVFFRGDVGKHRLPCYSRGIRQKLYRMAVEGGWKAKYNVLIGDGSEVPGDYSELLARSRFCLVLPGDGWSARAEDAVLHGCIPLVVMDEVMPVFEPQLDWASFSVRVKEADIAQIPSLATSVPDHILKKMQAALRTVWHRFAYTSHPMLKAEAETIMQRNLVQRQQQQQRRRRLAAIGHGRQGQARHEGGSLLEGSRSVGQGAEDLGYEHEEEEHEEQGPRQGMQLKHEVQQQRQSLASHEHGGQAGSLWHGRLPAGHDAEDVEYEDDYEYEEYEEREEEEGSQEPQLQHDPTAMWAGSGSSTGSTQGMPGRGSGRSSDNEKSNSWSGSGNRGRHALADHAFSGSRRETPRVYPFEDDAFGTIMQWLYSKIPDTRGPSGSKQHAEIV